MKKLIILLGVFVCLVVISCTNAGFIRTNETNTVYPNSDTSKIEIFSISKIGKDYTVIGQVMATVDAHEDANKPVMLLKQQASALGADAVINLRLSIQQGTWMKAISATGTAIKFK